MKKKITILVLVMFLIGILPNVFADQGSGNEESGKQVRAGVPIVFSTESSGSNDNENDDSGNGNGNSGNDVGTSNGNGGSGGSGSSGGGGGNGASVKRMISTSLQNSEQNEGKDNQIRNILRATLRINASELMENMNEQQQKVFSNMLRAQQKSVLSMNKSEALKEMTKYKLKEVEKENMFRKRIVGEDKKQQAMLNYGQAVKNYAQLNSIYKENRQEFLEVKEQLRNCTNVDDEECNELRDAALIRAKEYLVNGANMTIQHLEKIKNKIEGSEEIDEEKVTEMVGKIGEAIGQLQSAMQKAEAAQTKAELQEVAKEIHNIWNKFKNRERLYAAYLVDAQIWSIMRQSEALEQRLDNVLIVMEEQGIDITEINIKVDEFSAYVLDAKTKYNGAKELLQQARDEADEEKSKEMIQDARDLLKEAHDSLKDAHRLLVDIINDIKEAGGEFSKETELEEFYEVVEGDEE